MKKTVRKIVLILLVLVFIGSAAGFIHNLVDKQKGAEDYAEAESLANLPDLSALPPPTLDPEPLPEPAPAPSPDHTAAPAETAPAEEAPQPEPPKPTPDPYAEALQGMDFTALREANSDVVGWILIPGTVISYPLVQGADNQYYLNHTWRKGRNSVGSIFLECTNSRDLSDFNTIIYGHRVNNGSMFGPLRKYRDLSFWQSHPCVYITDDYGSHKYEIFAAYEVSTEGATYSLGLTSEQGKQNFIDFCLEQSVIDTGITPTVDDQVLTLSTCTGSGHATRWVVQAVRHGG